MPPSWPAICDPDVTRALIESARANPEVNFGTGVIMTTGVFYPGAIPSKRGVARAARDRGRDGAGRAGRDRRRSAGSASGGIFTVDGNDEAGEDMTGYNPHREVVAQGKERMIEVALEAVSRLAAAEESAATTTKGDH